MEFLWLLFNIVFIDIRTTFLTLLIGLIVYKLSKFYLQVYSLPPGPLPLPLLGNILLFRSKGHWDQVIKRLGQKYGPIFTVWLSNSPLVFITDPDIGREAFSKNEFAGRKSASFGKFISNEDHQDVAFTDYGETWEFLRKVAHSAALKYSTNDRLLYLITDCVDSTFKLMIEKEGINKGFKPNDYIPLLFLNVMTSSAFGKNYSLNDPEFRNINEVFKDMSHRVGVRQWLWEFSSIFRLIDRKLVKKQRDDIEWLITLFRNKFIDHYKDYSESIERNFCDALITAKNKAIREGKESAPYLKDENLSMCIFDLFGGFDITQYTFQWALLFLSYYPEIQQKLRQEIETQIGDRIATHEDRNRCHYVMAFIWEVFRLKNVAPTGGPHKAVVRSKIAEYTIPEGNLILVYHGITLTDEKYWSNALEFKPERFLENGMLVTTRPKAFIPFSVGRRVCLGEKLAIAQNFLVLVRFLQLSSDYTIVLGQNKGFEGDSNVFLFYPPYEYEIIFKPK